MRSSIFALALSLASPAFAESSLGITGATLSFGALQDESGAEQVLSRATVDVAITEAHGLQGDLSFEDTGHGTIGRLAAHLYMDPVHGQKYGLFFAMSDLDGRSLNWVSAGVEGQLDLSENLQIAGRTGLGRVDEGGLDYIFGGVSVAYAVSPATTFEATLDVADFDETDFRATSIDIGLRAAYSPEGSPWGIEATAIHSDLTGRDGAAGEMRLGLGLTMAFGNAGGTSRDTRHFRDHDAVAPLVRRGLQ